MWGLPEHTGIHTLSLFHTYVNTHTLTHFGFSAPVQKTILIGAFCSSNSAEDTFVFSQPPALDAQFSFDKRDVSVKLLMVLQDSASQTSKGIH